MRIIVMMGGRSLRVSFRQRSSCTSSLSYGEGRRGEGRGGRSGLGEQGQGWMKETGTAG